MRVFSLILFTITITLFGGCKKCDTDSLSGTYIVSGMLNGYYLQSDSTGTHTIYYTDTITNQMIDFTKIDNSTLQGTWANTTDMVDYIYSKENSSIKICTFISDYHGPGASFDTVWFHKNRDHAITIHTVYQRLTFGSVYNVTGKKI